MSSTKSELPNDPVRQQRAPMTGRRRWLFRLAAVGLALVPLVALELILRFVGAGYDTRLVIPSGLGPNSFRFNAAFDRSYYGLEDLSGPDQRTFDIPKPVGIYRVVVIGGSTVAGFPYPFELALPRHLEVVLNEQLPDRKFEVLNAGMIAINSLAELDVTRQVLVCQPDLVVVHSGHNEFYSPGGTASNFSSIVPALFPLTQFARRQRSFQLLMSFLSRPKQQNLVEWLPADVGIPLDGPKFRETSLRFRTNLERQVDLSKSSKIPILVSTVPANLRDLSPMQPLVNEGVASKLKEAAMRVSYKEYELALSAIQEARRTAPQDPLVAYREAQCLESLGRREESAEAYALAADLDGCRFRAARPFQDVTREVASSKGVYFCDVARELATRSQFPAPGSDFFLEHVHYSIEGNWQAATILGQSIVEQVLREKWRAERLPNQARRDELLGVMPLDYVAADSLATAVYDVPPFKLSPDRGREKQILLNRIAARMSEVDPMEREVFATLDMSAMEHHLWHALGDRLLAAGQPEKALVAFQRHIRRQPWSELGYSGAARALDALGRREEAAKMAAQSDRLGQARSGK